MTPEQRAIAEILLKLKPHQRLFRINAGMGWCGKVIKRTPTRLVLENPRPLHAAPEGWPDLSGWETVTITPDMVGKRVAIFRGVEVKATKGARCSQAQAAFGELLAGMGGVYEIARPQ